MITMLFCCKHTSTQLGDLSSVSEVGAGLFLGLALVQAIGSGGVTRLRRKASHLRATVTANRLKGQAASVRRIEADLLQLEMSLETLSRGLLVLCFALLAVALAGLGVVSLQADMAISCAAVAGILFYYLALPMIIFMIVAYRIHCKCAEPMKRISQVEKDILQKLLE